MTTKGCILITVYTTNILFLCGCMNTNSSGASVRRSWFYLGENGLSIGPSFEAQVSSEKNQHSSEVKYEKNSNGSNEHVYMATGQKKQELPCSNTAINVHVDNSQNHIDNSSNTRITNESTTQIKATNQTDASSTVIDNSTSNKDASVNVNSNNLNSKVNSEN